MNITVTCNSCGQKLSAPGALAGRRVPCPKCKAPLDVPAAQGIAGAPTTAPGPAYAVPQVVPENRPRSIQPPAAPVVADVGMIDLGLGAPLAPTARPAARPAGRSKGSLIPIIAIVVVLFLAGGGVGAWLMLSGKAGLGSDQNYLPDDSDVVASVDVGGIIASPAGQKIKAHLADVLANLTHMMPSDFKLKLEDFGRVTVGGRAQGDQGSVVIHMNRTVSESDFPDSGTGEKKTVGQHQLIIRHGTAACFLDDRTMLFGEEATLRAILERNGPAKMSDDLAAALGEVDSSKSMVVAMVMKNLIAEAAKTQPIAPGSADFIRSFAIQGSVGDDVQFKGVALCKDSSTAENGRKEAEGMIALAKNGQIPPAIKKILDSVEVSNSGSKIRGSATIDVDSILSLADQFKGLIPTAPPSPSATGSTPAARPLPERTTRTPRSPPKSVPPSSPFNPSGNVKDAAGRAEASNNLKQIALAMHGYHAAENHFPAAAICDAQGKPLLSWRVAILPQLGQTAIYKQFHLDEPWDSPNNKRLVNRLPAVYRSPRGSKLLGLGKTCFLAPIGERAAFFGQQGRKMADFTDGLTNTILIVEAAPDRAVPWTKPDDLTIDPNDPAAGLFGQRDGGFLAAFGDGSVRFVPQAVSKDVLAALFTINGGEMIPPDFGVSLRFVPQSTSQDALAAVFTPVRNQWPTGGPGGDYREK